MSTLTVQAQRVAQWVRELPPHAVDAAIAVLCAAYIVGQIGIEGRLSWAVPLLATVNAAPLLWRRRYPFLVTFITGISTTWLAIVDMLGNIPAAQLVATYTFAALCPPLLRLIAVAGTILGVSLSILIPAEDVLNLGMIGITFGMAYALGTSVRARRDRIEMLEERARRLTEQHEAAATRERQRIAREMHDILAHSMGLVVVQAEAGPVAVRSDPDKAAQMFDTISATARESLAQLRRTLGVLRAGEAERLPAPGLDGLTTLVEHARDSGLAVTLEEHGQRAAVPPDFAATVYRIVQESLTNTVKHAHAQTVHVTLDWQDDALEVTVSDDGRGLATDAEPGGHGLTGMRERVAALGGKLNIGANPDGTGFRITAWLPLQ